MCPSDAGHRVAALVIAAPGPAGDGFVGTRLRRLVAVMCGLATTTRMGGRSFPCMASGPNVPTSAINSRNLAVKRCMLSGESTESRSWCGVKAERLEGQGIRRDNETKILLFKRKSKLSCHSETAFSR